MRNAENTAPMEFVFGKITDSNLKVSRQVEDIKSLYYSKDGDYYTYTGRITVKISGKSTLGIELKNYINSSYSLSAETRDKTITFMILPAVFRISTKEQFYAYMQLVMDEAYTLGQESVRHELKKLLGISCD